jgi:hypothetical protein
MKTMIAFGVVFCLLLVVALHRTGNYHAPVP